MSEPTMPLGDPTAVILARMEVKLDNALEQQSRHSAIIDRHDRTLNEHGEAISVLKAQRENDTNHQTSGFTRIQTVAFIVSALVAVAALAVAIIVAARGH